MICLISLSNQMTNQRVYSRTQRILRHKRMSKKTHTRLRIEFQKQPNTTTTYKRIKKIVCWFVSFIFHVMDCKWQMAFEYEILLKKYMLKSSI